jgi:hypothetical protein
MQYRQLIEAMFQIVDRAAETVDFKLKPQQVVLDENFGRRNIIPKGRQGAGVSSYVLARYVAKCLAEENRRCVIVSHETDASARLLGRARFILNNLKGALKPMLGTDSVKAITFLKTGSSLWIGTAGARRFGRGDNITDLHLSEAAFYENPEEFTKGIFPAAEHGEIVVESTGNGVGNWYHRQCVRAREGRGFQLFFFPSQGMSDNVIPFGSDSEREHFMANLSEELEEPQLVETTGVSPEFLQWRRERLEVDFEGDLRAFRQEHPTSFDECFQSTGFSFFRRVRHVADPRWLRESRDLRVLQPHPMPGLRYVIGADVSGGVGGDNSVAQVVCLHTLEQVAEWTSGYREPHEFGDVLAALGRRFNGAYINVERNNHGRVTLKRLTETYPLHLLHKGSRGADSTQYIISRLEHYGTLVTEGNRGLLLGTARRLLAGEAIIHSEGLRSELGTFVEKENGKIEAESGCFDDRVMAMVHALAVIERAQILTAIEEPTAANDVDPFSWDALFGEQQVRERVALRPERFG